MNAERLNENGLTDKLQNSKYVTCDGRVSLLNYRNQMLSRSSSADEPRLAILETAKAHLRRFGEDKMLDFFNLAAREGMALTDAAPKAIP